MGITVDMFVKTYKANSKAKDKTFEDFIAKHITTKYVPFLTKSVYCDKIVESCCYIQDGDRKIVKIDSTKRYLFFIMRLIDLYTDIELDYQNKKSDIVSDFDKLNEIGAIDTLMSAIPESEYAEFSTLLNMKLDDFRDNEYSITALLYNLKQSFSLSGEVLKDALNSPELKKFIEEQNNN